LAGRFRVARSLKLADALYREINSFEVKMTPSGVETFSAWREQAHDDLVLSCALALYFGHPRRTSRPWGYECPVQLTAMKGEEPNGRVGAMGYGAEGDFLTLCLQQNCTKPSASAQARRSAKRKPGGHLRAEHRRRRPHQ
jgi:hypothetical protein